MRRGSTCAIRRDPAATPSSSAAAGPRRASDAADLEDSLAPAALAPPEHVGRRDCDEHDADRDREHRRLGRIGALVDLALELAQLRLDVVLGDLAIGHGVHGVLLLCVRRVIFAFVTQMPDASSTSAMTTAR